MNWILAYQTLYDIVKYYTNDEQSIRSMHYYDFKQYISKFAIKNIVELIENIDKFNTVLVNLDEGTWKIYMERDSNVPMEVLLKLNPEKGKVTNSLEDSKNQQQSVNKNFVKNHQNFHFLDIGDFIELFFTIKN